MTECQPCNAHMQVLGETRKSVIFLMTTSSPTLILDDSAPSLQNGAKSELVLRGRHLFLVILRFLHLLNVHFIPNELIPSRKRTRTLLCLF